MSQAKTDEVRLEWGEVGQSEQVVKVVSRPTSRIATLSQILDNPVNTANATPNADTIRAHI